VPALKVAWSEGGGNSSRVAARLLPTTALFLLSACSGQQSALAPAGMEAERVADLFWIMLLGAAAIWILVVGTAVYASRIRPGRHPERAARVLLLGGGVAFPTVALAALLGHGLSLMPELRAPGDGLKIVVAGEQWWWRVRYQVPGRPEPITSANEVRLPLGERVELELTSPDVIHSFWIPSLAGKVDMIPGRITRLVLEPTRTGEFRGVCAEFCGTSHALMAFRVVVMEKPAFADWLARQEADAAAEGSDRGGRLFHQVGCGSCHTIRGTAADGKIGPDLTHLADRRSLAAGILPMTRDALARWIAKTDEVKPGSRMPAFGALPKDDIEAIAGYLEGLE
jgi:cytochrome c oxidase subunit 2